MKPATFEYHVPSTTEETLALLAELGDDAKLLAGGQSLVPMMNFRLARPAHLIDLNRVAGLVGVEVDDGALVLGAMTRQRAIEHDPRIAAGWPLLGASVRFIGHAQIRNRGTVGGSVSHNDPAAELPAVTTALGATFVVESREERRSVTASQFFVDYLTTCLEPTELLTEIRIPAQATRTGWSFLEISRRHGDFALVGVAALLSLDDARVTSSQVILAGVGATTIPIRGIHKALVGQPLTVESAREAAAIAVSEIDPPSDIHASGAYRREVAGVLVRRALLEAGERAREVAA
jgi:CO/xanthine dehydrogenase FAD-binding subunit